MAPPTEAFFPSRSNIGLAAQRFGDGPSAAPVLPMPGHRGHRVQSTAESDAIGENTATASFVGKMSMWVILYVCGRNPFVTCCN